MQRFEEQQFACGWGAGGTEFCGEGPVLRVPYAFLKLSLRPPFLSAVQFGFDATFEFHLSRRSFRPSLDSSLQESAFCGRSHYEQAEEAASARSSVMCGFHGCER